MKRKLLKKFLVFSLIGCTFFSLSGCQDKPKEEKKNEEKTEEKKEEKEEPEDDSLTTGLDEKSDLETDTEAIESSNQETSTVTSSALSSNDQYEINLFLSNFAVQEFRDYDYDNFSDGVLVSFIFDYTVLERPDVVYVENDYSCIDLKDLNFASNRFFNIDFPVPAGTTFDGYTYIYSDGKLMFPAEYTMNRLTLGIFTVVESMTENPDGTFDITFKNYYIGKEPITDKSYYYTTPADAEASPEMMPIEKGTAVVKRKDPNQTNSYFLLRYHMQIYDPDNP